MGNTTQKLNIPTIKTEDFDAAFRVLASIRLSEDEVRHKVKEVEEQSDDSDSRSKE